MSPAARLIVCERSGRWASALRRTAGEPAFAIRETRNWDDAWTELEAAPASLVVRELAPPQLDRFDRLERLADDCLQTARERPRCRLVFVGDVAGRPDASGEVERLLREWGAVLIVRTERELDRVVRIARRHLGSGPVAERGWRESLFDRLPWGAVAESD